MTQTAAPWSAFDLTGRTALVTGARTGLGQGLAMALAGAGADIAGLGSSPMPETDARIRAMGRRFHGLKVDLGGEFDAGAVLAEVAEALGPVSILVNNAGIIRRHDLSDFPLADWDGVMDVNLRSAFRLSQAAAAGMEPGGRIINVASVLSFQGGIRVVSYTTSKHGIVGLTRALATELAPRGITVNAIAPGYMETDNTEALRADGNRAAEILGRIPVGRWGVPEDLATAVQFLAAPGSDYVTGTVIPVDGGWLVR
ncbi:SDR family oxidoreductase [Histidinibacterium lentulum]|uniref:SDR family oxidoreductase n=1 Tax=Histidinibacterium lentulum TaxID=2480588 RepID=A0A3N2QWB6_9RHOB|nr:SDR family oxidoreductase [Histidinibacterium lentulum]ROT99345.1 SDR family oxidoreductase [Histidinibacterium lentulum]